MITDTSKFDGHLVSTEFFANPYPTFAKLHEDDPVYWCDSWKSWFITRYADVMAMLREPTLFSHEGGRLHFWIIWRIRPSTICVRCDAFSLQVAC